MRSASIGVLPIILFSSSLPTDRGGIIPVTLLIQQSAAPSSWHGKEKLRKVQKHKEIELGHINDLMRS
jgi:hypothetical protein